MDDQSDRQSSAPRHVTVKFDKSLAVIEVEDGMGTGDPAPGR